MKYPLLSFLVAFYLLFYSSGFAQTPVFRQYNIKDGLASSEVYQVYQDSKSYIWVASNMGVSRFDGATFQNFDMQDGLPENTTFEIFEDYTGKIWFISFPFQLSYYYNDSIHQYKYNGVLKNLAGKGLVPLKGSFLIARDGGILFSLLDNGLYGISPDGNITLHTTDTHGSSGVIDVIEFEGKLLISMIKSLDDKVILRIKTNEINQNYEFQRSELFSHGDFFSFKAKDGSVYCAQNDRIIRFDTLGANTTASISARIVWLSGDQSDNVWVGTEKEGILCFRNGVISSKPITRYLNELTISSFQPDNEGGSWFSTIGQGIFYLSSNAFAYYGEKEGLSTNKVNCVEVFQGKIVIGTHDNYIHLIENDKISTVKVSDAVNGVIYRLANYNDSLLWIGSNSYLYSYNDRIIRKQINNHKFIEKAYTRSRNIFSIKDIYPVTGNKLLLGEARSLSILEGNQVTYNSFLDDKIELRVETIGKESDDSYLLGAFNGLWRWKNGEFSFLGNKTPVFSNRITDMAFSEDLKIKAFGTKGAGVIIQTPDTIRVFNKLSGISSNSITSLLIIEDMLWIATNNGLNKLDLKSIGFNKIDNTIYSAHDGLVSNEINQIAGDEKHIYIASNEGLTIFTPELYSEPKVPPPIYITSVDIVNEPTRLLSSYELEYNQNFITIKFVGISLRDGADIRYRYRLKGLNNNWNYTSNSQVDYAFLAPGDYEFEVKAITSDGLESEEPAIIGFSISPPFWETWWFLPAIALMLITIGVFFYRGRLKQLKRRHAMQSDINWYRQQSLTRQMDPHFVFNTLNSIQSYIVKNDRLSSSLYLSKFSKLMRIILTNSQPQAVPLQGEIEALNLYLELESLRFQKKFEFDILVDPEIDAHNYYIPAFLIQPFVENAIWHGIMGLETQGKIHIDFRKGNDQIVCTIEDNGIGRQKSYELKTATDHQRKSLGISLVESRLNLLNNMYNVKMKVIFTDLFTDNNKPAGTRVELNLPVIS